MPPSECEPEFLAILAQHGFGDLRPVVPLRRRYTKGRPWTREEFKACFEAWRDGTSLTLIAAALNRNPQDMIYRLLDHCHKVGIEFSERGRSEGSKNWGPEVAACASQLFNAGLPAWKIATLFRVDFEHVEKQMFLSRQDYGHRKRNPFSINTRHKHFVNREVLASASTEVHDALDAFAGEGETTEIIACRYPRARLVAVEQDAVTIEAAQKKQWNRRTSWICDDNLNVMRRCVTAGEQFDLIDLDPFVTCHEQLDMVWPLLKPRALLFVTFGGEYRRSFIGSNRKAIAARYGYMDAALANKDYLEVVPFFFLGWVAHLAARHSTVISVLRAVRYANNCRFWLDVQAADPATIRRWMLEHIVHESGGYRFEGCRLPRFAQVRHELDQQDQLALFA